MNLVGRRCVVTLSNSSGDNDSRSSSDRTRSARGWFERAAGWVLACLMMIALTGCLDDAEALATSGGGAVSSAAGSSTTGSSTAANPTDKAAAPVVTLTASPTTVIANMGTAVLTWKALNATQCLASGGWEGSIPLSGGWRSGELSNNTEFELTCTGKGGSASQSVTVTATSQTPQVTLQTSPSTVSSGGTSKLTWTAKDAAACTASGAWSGAKGVSGSQSTGPVTATSTYVLSCTGLGGKAASQSATVSVSSAAPVVAISASPSTIAKGSAATLAWSAKNATSCSASGGWSGIKATSGSQSTDAVEANTTYSLSCAGPGGKAVQSATVSVKSPTPTVNLSVGPSAVASGGSATLTWSSANATSCSASGGWSGNKGLNGSQSTGAVTANTTYVLTCRGQGGSASQSASISVKKPSPTITLSANPSSITSGNSSTLSWSSANTTSCTASGAWSGSKSVSGSQSTGFLKSNATYTLSCTGPGGNAVQTAVVTVTGAPTATVKLSATPSTVASGGSSTLAWSATNATACTASGGWSGGEPMSGSKSTGALKANATYTISCTGAGGSASQSTTVSVSQAAPTVSISASPSTIKSGSNSTLTWSSSNATSCTAAGAWSGSKSVSGSESTGALKANASYSITCTGAGGSATQSATVSVTAPTPAPTVTLSASPSTVASGGSSTVNWSATNATACTASGGWSGSMATSGSRSTGALKANTTYTLDCTGTGGSATQSATVSVNLPAPTITLSAGPSTVSKGAASMLSWSSTNATSCTASQGWAGSKAVSGTQSTGSLSTNQTYALTCAGSSGSASQSASVTVTAPAPTVTLIASPTTVSSGGKSTLTWSSTNANSCSASGGWSGAEGVSGSAGTAAVTATTKYTLTCTGTGGSAIQSVTVSVSTPAPAVNLSAAASSVASGASTMLSWSSSDATSCAASGGWSGALGTSGTQPTGAITSSTTYTVTCTGSAGSASQSVTVGVSSPQSGNAGSCAAQSGALSLQVKATRAAGISPFLVFFDATGTTDGSIRANATSFQDVTYSWNFGDSNASGTGRWAYGSNAGHNSKNSATGGVAAHLYITPGTDTSYTATVTASDGTNTASCQVAVTAYDPAGSNGFVGTNTTCVSASGTPTAGSGGCPAGAAVLNTPSFATALNSHLGSGKQVLFKCGDTFTGDNVDLVGVKWSVGAYGGCQGTQSGRPIFHDTGTNNLLTVDKTSGDGRISDIDCEGSGRTALSCVSGLSDFVRIPYQITLWNLNAGALQGGYSSTQGAQWGYIQLVQNGAGATYIGTFINSGENNPGTWSGNPFNNLDYQALIGSHITGVGCCSTNGGVETVRVPAARLMVIENNTIQDSNDVGAVLKIHNGNSYHSCAGNSIGGACWPCPIGGNFTTTTCWTGIYTELIEISDNLFTGNSGSNMVENSAQNANDDERLRNIVIERNLFSSGPGAPDGRQLLESASNATIRDNVFYIASGVSNPPFAGAQIAQRSLASGNPIPTGVEVYNNTCDFQSTQGGQYCAGFDISGSLNAPGDNGYAENNLLYASASHPTIANSGSGNTVSNNTVTSTANPQFINASGSFSLISDFQPAANYSGGTSVPVLYDALGIAWPPIWDLGAVHY